MQCTQKGIGDTNEKDWRYSDGSNCLSKNEDELPLSMASYSDPGKRFTSTYCTSWPTKSECESFISDIVSSSSFTWLWILLVVVVLAVLAAGAFFLMKKTGKKLGGNNPNRLLN